MPRVSFGKPPQPNFSIMSHRIQEQIKTASCPDKGGAGFYGDGLMVT